MADNKLSLSLTRSQEVLLQIRQLKTNLTDGLFDMIELLAETKREAHYEDWGYDSFTEFIANADLDMGKRNIDYYITILEKSKVLGITRDELKKSSATKLKAIFRLDPSTQGDVIRGLLSESVTETHDQIEAKVARIKAGPEGIPMRHVSFKFTLDGYENTVKGAIELMQQEYGDTINSATGEFEDISPGRALEMICADYLAGGSMASADPNHYQEQ